MCGIDDYQKFWSLMDDSSILKDKKLADAYKSLETIHDTYGRVIGNDAIQLRQRLEQTLKNDVKKKVLNWDEVWSTL